MREDPVDIYLRARTELMNSILDGYDYGYSVGNYLLAKANLERHGFEYQPSHYDVLCDIVAKEELDEEKRKTMTLEDFERLAEQEGDAEERKRFEEGKGKQEEKAQKFRHQRGHVQKLRPHIWDDGRIKQHSIADVMSRWMEADTLPGSPYENAHFGHELHHPMREHNVVTGTPRWIDTLREFYLPNVPGGQSLSQLYKEKENAHQRIHSKKEHPLVNGITRYDTAEGRDVTHHAFLGPLGDSHLHDIYEDNYQGWLDNNRELERSLMEQYPKPEEHDFALRQAHFENAAQGWLDETPQDMSFDPKSEMSPDEVYERLNRGEDLTEVPLMNSLGHMGYLLGLEFLSPQQRLKVSQHLHSKGTDRHDAQSIDIGGGKSVSAGRIKRNLRHRFTGEFHHAHRAQNLTGPNVKAHWESVNDHPEGIKHFIKHSSHQAVHATEHPSGGSMADHILEELNDMLFGIDSTDGLQHLPPMSEKHFAKMKGEAKKMEEQEGLSYDEAIARAFKMNDKEDAVQYADPRGIQMLLGYDPETGNAYSEHPFLPDFDGPLVGEEGLASIFNTAKDMAEVGVHAKDSRNADKAIHGGFNGPRLEDIPEDERDAWLIGPEGPVGKAAHFSKHYQTQGGRGRSAITLLQKLHSMLPKDDEGHSLIGRIERTGMSEHFVPNPKTLGLFAPFLPFMADKHSMVHNGALGATSFFDASKVTGGRAARNPKQLMYHGKTVRSPGYSNDPKVYGLSRAERQAPGGIDGSSHEMHLGGRVNEFQNGLLSTGTATGGDSHSLENSRISHSNITRLGRIADEDVGFPPHNPAPFRYLTHKQMGNDQYPRSHSQSNINAFKRFHALDGITDMGLEISDAVRDQIMELEAAEYDIETRMETADSDELDALEQQARSIRNEIGDLMRGSGIREASQAAGRKRKRGFTSHLNTDDQMVNDDLVAITEMAKKLRPMMESADPDAFNPNNPQRFIANVSRLFRDANRGLMVLPHDFHGLTTHGYGLDDIEKKSASAMLSQSTGEKVVPHRNLALILGQAGVEIRPDMSRENIMNKLGLPNDSAHQAMVDQLMERMDGPIKAMKHGDILGSGVQFHPRSDISLHTGREDHHAAVDETLANAEWYRKKDRNRAKAWWAENYGPKLQFLPRIMGMGETDKYGLSHVPMASGAVGNEAGLIEGKANETKRRLHDLFIFDPSKANMDFITQEKIDEDTETVTQAGYGQRPIHPATSMQGTKISDYFVSGDMEAALPHTPTVGIEFQNGQPVAGTNTREQMMHTVPLPWQQDVFGKEVTDQVYSQGYVHPTTSQNFSRTSTAMGGEAESDEPTQIALSADEVLTALMDPDAIYKEDKGSPPPILAMHRIFSLKDFKALRGFSGEWAASLLPDGEQFIVQRKGNKVTAYGNDGSLNLDADDKKQFKALADKDFMLHVVRAGTEIHVVDLIEYDDTNVADMTVRERMKVLRGQFDSHEHIIVPGPHNFRLTDHEGLQDAVDSLKEGGNRILLRDATSTYMRGERRHPKWFLLRPTKRVTLIVLDVRGKGPYTYRLGAGPLDAEGFGNRGVDHDGESYLDVGTVRSPKPFEEGDVIDVAVSGVRRKKRGEKELYDVTASKIVGEADDAPSSLETLSLLAKSDPVIPVPFDLTLGEEHLTVSLHKVDDVVFKMETGRYGTWVHSPKTALGEITKSDYALLLAESVRPLWSEAASLMMKGVEKKADIEESARSMSKPKHRKHSEKESAGIIDADDEMNVLKPDEIEAMTKTLSRIVDLVDRVEKEKMSGRTSAQGYGIDMASGVESPRGPTSLMSEQSLPDWDMKERPEEDPEPEYPAARSKRKRIENEEQSTGYQAESQNE